MDSSFLAYDKLQEEEESPREHAAPPPPVQNEEHAAPQPAQGREEEEVVRTEVRVGKRRVWVEHLASTPMQDVVRSAQQKVAGTRLVGVGDTQPVVVTEDPSEGDHGWRRGYPGVARAAHPYELVEDDAAGVLLRNSNATDRAPRRVLCCMPGPPTGNMYLHKPASHEPAENLRWTMRVLMLLALVQRGIMFAVVYLSVYYSKVGRMLIEHSGTLVIMLLVAWVILVYAATKHASQCGDAMSLLTLTLYTTLASLTLVLLGVHVTFVFAMFMLAMHITPIVMLFLVSLLHRKPQEALSIQHLMNTTAGLVLGTGVFATMYATQLPCDAIAVSALMAAYTMYAFVMVFSTFGSLVYVLEHLPMIPLLRMVNMMILLPMAATMRCARNPFAASPDEVASGTPATLVRTADQASDDSDAADDNLSTGSTMSDSDR